ncbi:MAG: CBS domain-containing protein [Deltaproteobacteria bacterium]
MKSLKVTNLMTPLSMCPTVSEEATLREAMSALDTTRLRVDAPDYRPRFVVVYDKHYNVVGVLRQTDVLKSLEPKYSRIEESGRVAPSEFDSHAIASLMEEYDLWDEPLTDMCHRAKDRKVKDIAARPGEEEFIHEDASIAEAIHMMLMGNRASLLVKGEAGVTGILRLSDIFNVFCKELRQLDS